jgi:hypothetical protein
LFKKRSTNIRSMTLALQIREIPKALAEVTLDKSHPDYRYLAGG